MALTVRSLSSSVFRWAADRFIVLRFVPSSGGVACLDTNQRLSRSVVKTLMLVPLGRSPGEPPLCCDVMYVTVRQLSMDIIIDGPCRLRWQPGLGVVLLLNRLVKRAYPKSR